MYNLMWIPYKDWTNERRGRGGLFMYECFHRRQMVLVMCSPAMLLHYLHHFAGGLYTRFPYLMQGAICRVCICMYECRYECI